MPRISDKIYTPKRLSEFLFSIISPNVKKEDGFVLDPCVGNGSLVDPFITDGYDVVGIDIKDQGFMNCEILDYLLIEKWERDVPSIVMIHPPFSDNKSKEKYVSLGLYKHYMECTEKFLYKTIKLFSKNIPIVFFVPFSFRLHYRFKNNIKMDNSGADFPDITSIVSLPINIFNDYFIYAEILIYNINNLKPHYYFI